MSRRLALALVVAVGVGSVPGWAKEKPADLKDECRTVALLYFDATAKKITVVPQRIELSYPQAGEFANEICFMWMVSNVPSGGANNFESLAISGHDKTKGKKSDGKEYPLLKKKKEYDKNTDNSFVSLDFDLDAIPNWDPDGDGQKANLRMNYKIEGTYKVGGTTTVITFDPDIIIQKPGG